MKLLLDTIGKRANSKGIGFTFSKCSIKFDVVFVDEYWFSQKIKILWFQNYDLDPKFFFASAKF